MPLILPNDIANEQEADGDKLQQNFRTIEDWGNSEAIVRDGSVAMTNPLLLPGEPTLDNQAATKAYVDRAGIGLIQRNMKPSQELGYDTTDAIVNGLTITVPPSPTGRVHEVEFTLRVAASTDPVPGSYIFVSLRVGSVSGSLTDRFRFPFPQGYVGGYDWDLHGRFTPTGLVPGGSYIISSSCSSGRFGIMANSWSALLDVGKGPSS